MNFSKCPRCDLNYIFGNQRFCGVCKLAMQGIIAREELCSNCNNPAMPDSELCEECAAKEQREQQRVEQTDTGDENVREGGEHVDPRSITEMEGISSMEELPDSSEDMSSEEIASLERLREEEELDEDEEEDEDDL